MPDDEAARARAIQIVHELQRGDEENWSGYMMELMRDGRLLWEIPFEVSYPPRGPSTRLPSGAL